MTHFKMFSSLICMSTAVSIYVIGNQWKLRDASDLVSYGNGGTHTLNNRLLVEEQEERSHSVRLGDFQQSHTLPRNVSECVLVHFDTNTHEKKKSSPIHTPAHKHKQVQICGYKPQWLLFLGVYTLVGLVSK